MKYEFTAEIKAVVGVDGAYIEFPYDAKAEFGAGGSVKVVATFDGVEYRDSLVKMGLPCHILGIRKDIRTRIGKQPGDTVDVTIERDMENAVDELPEAFTTALAGDPGASQFFKGLTPSQKNKFIASVASAKRQETAAARLDKAMGMLRRGEKMK